MNKNEKSLLILLSTLLLLGALGLAGVAFVMMKKQRAKAELAEASAHARTLAMATLAYTLDHKGKFPDQDWTNKIAPYFAARSAGSHHAGGSQNLTAGLAFNEALSGQEIERVPRPSQTVLFFEAQPGIDFGGLSELARKPKYIRYRFVFVDGHVELLDDPSTQSWAWTLPTFGNP